MLCHNFLECTPPVLDLILRKNFLMDMFGSVQSFRYRKWHCIRSTLTTSPMYLFFTRENAVEQCISGKDHAYTSPLLSFAHWPALHNLLSKFSPSHAPAVLQDLDLNDVPSPHDTLHDDHGDHNPQSPSAITKTCYSCLRFYFARKTKGTCLTWIHITLIWLWWWPNASVIWGSS